MPEVEPLWMGFANSGLAIGGVVGCFVCLLAGMHFVKALWS